ncbi:MAG TPA: anti-sigma factor [Chloroflexota bacterium]
MLTCEHVGELGDAYALGALDPDEAQELKQHLEGCPTCRGQVAADQALATALTLAPPQVEPPARLRASLLGAARGDGAASIRPAWWRRLFPAPTRLAFGAASLASLAFVVTLSWALTLQSQLARPGAPISAGSGAVPAASAPIMDLGGDGYLARADMKRLVAADAAPEARGWIYVDPAADSALLVAYRLPPLAPDRAYQLWLVRDGQRVSGGVFKVDAEGYGWLKVRAPQTFAAYQRVGITVEPLAGSPGPTGARVLGGDL